MTDIQTLVVRPGTAELDCCARWRVEAFSDVLGASIEDERKTLDRFTTDQTHQVALIAKCDGVAAGTCLLVPAEIDPVHAVSPWLAGLYVTPEFRRLGVGRHLVRAIEAAARERGHDRLFLYTDMAEPYYARLRWRVTDRCDWKGFATALMERDLHGAERTLGSNPHHWQT